MTKRQL